MSLQVILESLCTTLRKPDLQEQISGKAGDEEDFTFEVFAFGAEGWQRECGHWCKSQPLMAE